MLKISTSLSRILSHVASTIYPAVLIINKDPPRTCYRLKKRNYFVLKGFKNFFLSYRDGHFCCKVAFLKGKDVHL